MLEWLELEEQVGKVWHRMVGGAESYARHPEQAVTLAELRGALAVYFHSLGGGAGVVLAAGGARTSEHRLSWRQRLGMADEKIEAARLDETSLVLPDRLDLFPERGLNRDLYFWLSAWLVQAWAQGPAVQAEPLARDLEILAKALAATRATLAAYPGLKPRHDRLCAALRAARPGRSLPEAESRVEEIVLHLLGGPAPGTGAAPWWWLVSRGGQGPWPATPRRYRPFLPVPLWGAVAHHAPEERETDEDPDAQPAQGKQDEKKRRAIRKQQDQAERDDPLIFNRFEKILSIAEMVNVNRGKEDDDEEEAKKAAEDLDHLTLSKNDFKTATKLKLDLDLPPAAVGGGPVVARHVYPEWDFRLQAYHPAHCAVLAQTATEEGADWLPDAATHRRIRRVRRQFEALRPRRLVLTRQADGDDLDLEALVRSRCDLMAGGVGSDRVYTQLRNAARDLSVALLVDASLSTDSWIDNRRVLDVEKEALTVFAHGLEACGDEHAIFSFTSKRRSRVRVETLKDFDETLSPTVLRRIAAVKPGFYTRIGAAVRHAAVELGKRPHRHRLLLVLTDGKPNDVDHYEGRYGIEDTRRAVQEARRQGLAVFGITVDGKAQDYFPALFGRGSFAIVDHVDKLSLALPRIYRQLIQ